MEKDRGERPSVRKLKHCQLTGKRRAWPGLERDFCTGGKARLDVHQGSKRPASRRGFGEHLGKEGCRSLWGRRARAQSGGQVIWREVQIQFTKDCTTTYKLVPNLWVTLVDRMMES